MSLIHGCQRKRRDHELKSGNEKTKPNYHCKNEIFSHDKHRVNVQELAQEVLYRNFFQLSQGHRLKL